MVDQIIRVGSYETQVTYEPKPLMPKHVKEIQAVLAEWQEVFPREPTWVQNEFGVPSLFVRADCVIDSGTDSVRFYEIEERPGGMGLLLQFVPGMPERLAKIRREWPEFGFVASHLRGDTEDKFWLERKSDGLVLVRAEPNESQFHHFQPRSVSTVITKGDKSYGEKLGWWWEVREEDVLPAETGFVLKPKKGSKCRGLCFYAPLRKLGKREARSGTDKLLKKSNSTVDEIERMLSLERTMYCQPYIPPMESGIPGYEFMIYRLMFGYSPSRKSWEYIGGTWNARDNLRVHGASDTLFGPVALS